MSKFFSGENFHVLPLVLLQVMKGRGKLAKAVAVRDWKLVLRVWKAWRRFVQDRRERRARDQLARWLQREKR